MAVIEKSSQVSSNQHGPLLKDSDQNNFESSNTAFSNSLFSKSFTTDIQPSHNFSTISNQTDTTIQPVSFVVGATISGSGPSTQTLASSISSTSSTVTVGTNTNWDLTLTNATIKSEVIADVAGGGFTYSEMLAILNTVQSSGTVTTSEMSDLKTIASNLNVGITTSSYITDITDKLILGDAANAHWNGGSNYPITLGNLNIGTTPTQLSELIGKWFLGTDLPATGYSNVGYANVSQPLYGSSGAPSASDVNQGYLGDCYFLASVAEVATMEPSAIQSMIQSDGNGVYGVRFFINGAADWVTVNSALPEYNNSLIFNSSPNALWADLLEKAYVELNSSGVLPRTAGNAYALIEGGWADPITEITGKSTTQYSVNNVTADQNKLKQTMINAINAHNEVWLGSFGNQSINGMTTFVANHAYSVIGYDSTTGNFVIRNPWGTEPGQYWNTTFEASMSNLYADGAMIAVANGGASINNISYSSPSSDLNAGKIVTITLSFGSSVQVTGIPTLTLNDGGVATYTGGTGTNTLTFGYMVLAGQNTPSLQVTSVNLPNNANIMNTSGAITNLSIAGLSQNGPQIDTINPNTPVITTDSVRENVVTLYGTAEANSTITVFDGSTRLGTAVTSGSGSWSYTTGTLANGSNVFTATATDQAGNASGTSTTFTQAINYTAPKISTLSVTGTNITNNKGIVGTGKVITITLNMSGSVFVSGTPTLTLNDGGTATYVSGSGTNSLNFNYTVAAGQNTPALAITAVNFPNSATVKDEVGNTATLSAAVTSFTGLQINTTPPNSPIITNAVVNSFKATLTGTADANSIVTVYDGSTKLGTVTTGTNGSWSYTTGTLANGINQLKATETNTAGNTSAFSSNLVEVAVGSGTLISNNNEIDTLIGTGGTDYFYVNNSADKISQVSGGIGYVITTANFVLPTNVDYMQLAGNATQGIGNNDSINYLYGNTSLASTLTAGNGTDTLYVMGASGTTLNGGTGKDTFAFPTHTGHDTVNNFHVSNDVLQFNSALFSNFAAAMADTKQVGANTVITIDSNNSIILTNVTKTTLTANNFHFA